MPRKSTGKPAHRPLIPIDWTIVDKMILAGSSGVEIAGHLNLCLDTFYDRYRQEKGVSFSIGRALREPGGCGMLRLRQFQSAMQGNSRMLDKLGDERLGQGKKREELPPLDEKLDLTIDLLEQNKIKDQRIKELEHQLNATKS